MTKRQTRTTGRWSLTLLLAGLIVAYAVPSSIASGEGEEDYASDSSRPTAAELDTQIERLEANLALLESSTQKLGGCNDRLETYLKGGATLEAHAELQALLALLLEAEVALNEVESTLASWESGLKVDVYLKAKIDLLLKLKAKVESVISDLEIVVKAAVKILSEVYMVSTVLLHLVAVVKAKLYVILDIIAKIHACVFLQVKASLFLSLIVIGDKEKDKEKDQEYGKEKGKDKEYGKDKGKDKEYGKDKEKDHDQDKGKDHGKDKDPKDPKYPKKPKRECPSGFKGSAHKDTSVSLEWKPASGSDATRLYRSAGDEGFELIGTFGANTTSHTDTDTEVGVTYTYVATSVYDGEEKKNCQKVEVTAIPVFPTVLAVGAALGIGLLGYAVVRRRT